MGGSIIEMVVVLVAAAAMTVLGIKQDVAHRRAQLLAAEGQNQLTIVDAIGDWATDNYATILAQYTASGSSTITPPTIDQLYTAGDLKQSYSAGPFWAGVYVIQMSMVPAGCTEADGNCSVSYAMYTSKPLMKGTQYDIDGASQIAQAGGAQFGYSRSQASSTITGLNGKWSATNPLGAVPAVVLATNGPGTDGNALFIRRDGSLTWTGNQNVNGVDLDNAGNIYSTKTVQGQTLSAVNGAQTTSITNDGSGNTTIAQNGTVQVMNASSSGYAPLSAGPVTSSGAFHPGAIAVANTACTNNGDAASNSDSSGLWLQCLYHVWTPMAGPVMQEGLTPVSYGTVVAAPVCPTGGAPKITIATQNFTVDDTATVNWLTSGTGPWTVYAVDGNSQPISAVGMATTSCAF